MGNNKKWVLDNTANKRNIYILSILKQYVPSFARHMFTDNHVVEAFYYSTNGGVNPFDMPMCGVCSRPGTRIGDPAFNKEPNKYDPVTGEIVEKINCYCDNHGVTYDTLDLRHYLIEELKLNPEIIMKIEFALYEGGI